MATFPLKNGVEMPAVGLGTWQSKPGELQAAVKTAIEKGYRLIDCAYIYGNESEVGQALTEVIQDGTAAREDLFVISKLWNTHHHPDDVRSGLQESLNRLQLQYLDLCLIHWPMAFKVLEECVSDGLIRSIGLSNFNSEQIQYVIDHGCIPPAVLQVEIHPYFQQSKLVNFCKQRNVAVIAYSCFGSPSRPCATYMEKLREQQRFDNLGMTADGDELVMPRRSMQRSSACTADPDSEKSILEDECLISIASRLGKTPAQVILRWLFQRGITSIPKSVTPSRIQQNFQIFDFELTSEHMNTMEKLDRNTRLVAPAVVRNGVREWRDKQAPHFPFNIEF